MTKEEFDKKMAEGQFNTNLTYERYLEIQELRKERARKELMQIIRDMYEGISDPEIESMISRNFWEIFERF